MTSSQTSNRETEVTETSIQPQKSNKITSFFAKLVSWSSRDNLTNETKQNNQKKKRLTFFKSKTQEAQSQSSFYEKKEDFGVAETETLPHFAKPKPPKNRRTVRPTKVTPILTDLPEEPDENDLEINRKVMKKEIIVNKSHVSKSKEDIHNEINENDIEEIDSKNDTTEETGDKEVIIMRKNVMTELNRSLSSRLNGTKSLCQPSDQLKPKTKNNRPSDIFTQRLRSQTSSDGIENPTSL